MGGRMGRFGGTAADKKSKDEQQLTKITRDSSKLAVEQVKGMSSQVRLTSIPAPALRNSSKLAVEQVRGMSRHAPLSSLETLDPVEAPQSPVDSMSQPFARRVPSFYNPQPQLSALV